MANTKLSYPDVTTYIVIWGPEKKEFKGWAEAEPNQCFESKWPEVDYYTDAATVGKVRGFEYLFEMDYARQQGVDYIDQHHFIRYSSDDDCEGPFCINHFAAKIEYLENGFADIEYFEASERYRYKKDKNLAFSI